MDRFERLREVVLPILKPYGLKRLAVFGSYARGEDTPGSDIDLLVEFEQPPRKRLGLLEWVGMEQEMGDVLGREVELVSTRTLKPLIRPHVERDLKVLYEEG